VMKLGGKLNETNKDKYEFILSKSVWLNEPNQETKEGTP